MTGISTVEGITTYRRVPSESARLSLPVVIGAVLMGLVLGLGLSVHRDNAFGAGVLILAALAAAVVFLGRIARSTDDKLKAGDASYRAFFDHAIEGIFRTTPDGHYLDVNPALAQIYGYDTPKALMRGLTDIAAQLYADPGRRGEFRALMQAHDRVTEFVSEINRRDGSRIWISENARAVRDWAGQLICYEGTVENVTSRFEAERAIRAALVEAEEANRAKSAFLAAMSHELKTPLNAVIGFSEIIKEELFGPIGVASYLGYAHDIHASGTKLLSIINDVLDVARLQGGAITIRTRACEVNDIAEGAVALARRATGEEREIAVDLPPAIWPIDVDPHRLRQAIANLLSNALKFTPPEGRVAIRVRQDKTIGVVFDIMDTGIGMAPEKVAAALEAFRQLDRSLARQFEGAGLGLSIAKSLVELHGGALAIQSAVGEGTTVTITLPPARLRIREAIAAH